MTTSAVPATVLTEQLAAALALPSSPEADADIAIETASVKLIAARLRESVPTARYLNIDWSSQGPHHELDRVTDLDGNNVLTDAVDDETEVSLLVTNLRGAISDQFEAINADGGVYRIDLNNF